METTTLDTANLIASLATAGLEPKTIGQSTHLLLAPGYTHKDVTSLVEAALPAPSRKRLTVALGDVASLLAYCKDQDASATGYIYADGDARSLTAVFNDLKAGPGWRDHRAVYKAELTPEALLWMGKSGHQFGQTEFAEFIEDNFADLQGEEAQSLLTVATTIAATTAINFSASKRLQDGQTQLTYNETIDASAGADGAMKIPKTFTLGVQLFKGAPVADMFTARLKYRLHSGSVKFWFELDRPEKVVELAFAAYVKQVAEQSGYTVLAGKA